MATRPNTDQQRFALYRQGKNDYEIAAELRMSASGVRYWRKVRGLKTNTDQVSMPMEQALSESQVKKMKSFLGCLTAYADRFLGERIDVLGFAGAWREGMAQ